MKSNVLKFLADKIESTHKIYPNANLDLWKSSMDFVVTRPFSSKCFEKSQEWLHITLDISESGIWLARFRWYQLSKVSFAESRIDF